MKAATIKQAINILIADDDIDDQMLLRDGFIEANIPASFGFASDGEELLEMLRKPGAVHKKGVDLVILDLNMPRMDGLEALDSLRSDPELEETAVIVLSTSDNPQDSRRCIQLGALDYLGKPNSGDGYATLASSIYNAWLAKGITPDA